MAMVVVVVVVVPEVVVWWCDGKEDPLSRMECPKARICAVQSEIRVTPIEADKKDTRGKICVTREFTSLYRRIYNRPHPQTIYQHEDCARYIGASPH